MRYILGLFIILIACSAYQVYDMGLRYKRLLCDYEASLQLLCVACKRAHALEQQLTATEYDIEIYEATAYAPLDPKAQKGMCYSGDPWLTASGMPTKPGVTVAADPSIPFGTWLYIKGIGWRRVDDRGGAIKGKRIDICMRTQEEALKFGRKKVIVIIPKPNRVAIVTGRR